MYSLTCIILLFGFIAVGNGQYVGRTRRPPLPEICSRIFCPMADCINPVRPEGECCPVCRGPKPGRCPRRRNEAGICAFLCTDDSNCPGNQKCCSVGCGSSCMRPRGRCSRGVICPQLRCANQYTPPGECCPVCRPVGPIKPDCSTTPCTMQFCEGQYIPDGQCCPVCPNTAY
ncbi:uncharacterized protein DDB_G0274171-like [Ruditapes philippinarum]|uniref:uncharacterized protein DDB_G0274171-like n=1 Tax=Ruditapes philippinarum TaxID=129788 RepID=UPI00295BCDC9|nr:uncharacterized protein DDB_G0274171-like [Ruditapes philippinarum]